MEWEQLNGFDFAGLFSLLFILLASVAIWIDRASPQSKKGPSPLGQADSWITRLHRGMNRPREQLVGTLSSLFGGKGPSEEILEEVEQTLYEADLGPQTTQQLMGELRKNVGRQDYTLDDFKSLIREVLGKKLTAIQDTARNPLSFDPNGPRETKAIMMIGVNGAGKTTTIGKLATKLRRKGATVVVGACDTFRAAAVDQLAVWCERAECEMVRAKEGADPSGVAYEAFQKALALKADYCLLDTAGRLHTKTNLMDELKKGKRVLSKLHPSAPHEIILIIDAITGQNAMLQAKAFHQSFGLTGLILTKCDGPSKAGVAFNIVEQLGLPISFVGVGEGVDDLNRFDSNEYLDALLTP